MQLHPIDCHMGSQCYLQRRSVGKSAPGADCNFAVPTKVVRCLMPPLSLHFAIITTIFGAPFLIATQGGPPLCPSPLATPLFTCHPTQVNSPRLNPNQTGWYSIYLPRRDRRVS